METKTRILVADSNQDFCRLITDTFSREKDLDVVGVAGDGRGHAHDELGKRRAYRHNREARHAFRHAEPSGDAASAVHKEVGAKDEQGKSEHDENKAEKHDGPFRIGDTTSEYSMARFAPIRVGDRLPSESTDAPTLQTSPNSGPSV